MTLSSKPPNGATGGSRKKVRNPYVKKNRNGDTSFGISLTGSSNQGATNQTPQDPSCIKDGDEGRCRLKVTGEKSDVRLPSKCTVEQSCRQNDRRVPQNPYMKASQSSNKYERSYDCGPLNGEIIGDYARTSKSDGVNRMYTNDEQSEGINIHNVKISREQMMQGNEPSMNTEAQSQTNQNKQFDSTNANLPTGNDAVCSTKQVDAIRKSHEEFNDKSKNQIGKQLTSLNQHKQKHKDFDLSGHDTVTITTERAYKGNWTEGRNEPRAFNSITNEAGENFTSQKGRVQKINNPYLKKRKHLESLSSHEIVLGSRSQQSTIEVGIREIKPFDDLAVNKDSDANVQVMNKKAQSSINASICQGGEEARIEVALDPSKDHSTKHSVEKNE